MFENDDVILPDDFESTPQEEVTEEVQEETVSEEVDTNETEQTEEMTQEEKRAFLKVKYNKEEVELDEDRARELAQKGLNYDKVTEQLNALKSDPRLSFVENLAKENGMTTEQFIEAFTQQKEQERLNELIQQNIPEELAKEILESRKDRESRKQKEQEELTKQNQQKDQIEFLDYFKQVNGRAYDPDKDTIPTEVWDMVQKGTPLKFAYMQHNHNELQTQLKILKQNEENKKKAPVGSVTNHGSQETTVEDDFLKGFNSI